MSSTALAVSQIRAFDSAKDATWLHRLWHRTMHARWSLTIDSMQKVLVATRSLLVAERGGTRIGFCAADHGSTSDAGLIALVVDPAFRRQRVGSTLISEMKRILTAARVTSLHLGGFSTGTYFWPGLPAENEAALPFFTKLGWRQEEPCADLIQELESFTTPSWVSDRIRGAGVVFRLADLGRLDETISFERLNFPAWAPFVENDFADSDGQNILLAQDKDGTILGTVLMSAGVSSLWAADSGVCVGSLNILGVSPDHERQGIGLALAARAMEILQERGCSRCYIQWTGLDAWYGKLGASVWAEYQMASTLLAEPRR